MMKRMISLLLVLVMVLAMIPMTVFAEEGEAAEVTEVTQETEPAEETEPAVEEVTVTAEETQAAEPVCTCGTDDVAVHATSCPLYVLPEEPQCFCAEKCIEANEWCDICGFDYTACTGEDMAITYEEETATIGGTSADGLTWTYDEASGVLTISGEGPMMDYTTDNTPWDDYETKIKTIVIEEGVTSVGDYAFRNGTKITSVTMPEGITSVGERAFYECKNITNLNLPDSITYIGYLAFYNCEDLADIHFPRSLITLDEDAFKNCDSLVSVDLPEGVTSIGKQAFSYCDNLTSVYLPGSLTFIGGSAFLECNKLEQIAIPDGITSIENRMFAGCSGLTNVTLPSGLQTIGTQAFDRCTSLTAIDIPESVTVIDNFAFQDCASLTEIVIPDGVTVLSIGVLKDCTSITNIVLHGGVVEIGQNALKGSGIETIHYLGDTSAWAQIKINTSDGTLGNADIHYCTYEAAVEPTCTENGREDAWVCDQCGVVRGGEEIPALDHNFEGGVCTGCGAEHPNLANYKGKVISIMGDSISSFKGYIPVADGFNEEHPHAYPARDVQSWDKTWWGLVINSLDAKLGINDSWSGSRVHNYSTADNPGGNIGVKVCMSSITRVSNLGANGTPDIIFVYGGTNDGKFSPFGGFDPSRDYSQVDLDAVTWKTFEDAYVAMIQRMQHYYPEAKIIALLPTPVASWYTDEKLATMNSSIKEICNYFGVDYVDLPECGITLADLPDGLHPNAAGMSYIADAVLEVLLNTPEEAGENIVHSITHNLNGAKASKGHYKGVSNNKSFEEKLTGELECVSVTMNGVDITKSCYQNGTVSIPSVNGDVVITEKGHSYENSICTGCGEAQPGPIITQQPESVQQEIGKKFAITVKAEGEGLRYQWYVKESGAKAFKLSVNKTASYAYTMQTYMHKRQVYCVVTDINGNFVQTEIATITRPPMELKLLAQPEDVCVEIGQKFSVKPTVQGDDLTYQWYYKESYMKEFAVSSNKTPAYAYTMQTYMHNRTVYCVITDKDGNSVRTEPATITRPPMELKLLTQPEDVYAEKGEKFSIKPNVQGDGLTYQWYYKESYQKKFSASSNKSSAYAYAMQSYMNGRSVYCVITDQYGNQVQTEAVTIHLK